MKIKRENGYWTTYPKDECEWVLRHNNLFDAIWRCIREKMYELGL